MKFKSTASKITIVLVALLIQTQAFAIDQVTLTSGEIIQGTVLNDVPHQHVDIQLVNGTKRRIPRDQVTDVERDVPSNLDSKKMGSTSGGYFGLLVGLEDNLSTSKKALFSLGGRAGANVSQMGDFSALAFGLEYNFANDAGYTTHDILLQMLFRKVSNSGFYFGPEAGIAIASVLSINATAFEVGGLAGYDFFVSDGFSLGAEAKYDYQFKSDFISMSRIKFLLSSTFHF